jgi:hypothetical protein
LVIGILEPPITQKLLTHNTSEFNRLLEFVITCFCNKTQLPKIHCIIQFS